LAKWSSITHWVKGSVTIGLAVGVGGGGDDAIDHGRGEGDIVLDPGGEGRRAQRRELAHDAADGLAIRGEVVAAHHGEGRDASSVAKLERPHQQARRADRGFRVGKVVRDIGVAGIEAARRGVVAITLLGDGQRDDADGRIGHGGDQLVARDIGVNDVEDRADHAGAGAGGIADSDGVEEVLRGERVARIGPAQRRADDAPAWIGREQIVDIDSHVGAMERADADMDDAGRDGTAVIGKRPGECRAVQSGHEASRREC
jgi:hypothetical protein